MTFAATRRSVVGGQQALRELRLDRRGYRPRLRINGHFNPYPSDRLGDLAFHICEAEAKGYPSEDDNCADATCLSTSSTHNQDRAVCISMLSHRVGVAKRLSESTGHSGQPPEKLRAVLGALR